MLTRDKGGKRRNWEPKQPIYGVVRETRYRQDKTKIYQNAPNSAGHGKKVKMDDGIPEVRWGRVAGKEFQDVFSDIEIDESKVPPEQQEREKRLDKKHKFGRKLLKKQGTT